MKYCWYNYIKVSVTLNQDYPWLHIIVITRLLSPILRATGAGSITSAACTFLHTAIGARHKKGYLCRLVVPGAILEPPVQCTLVHTPNLHKSVEYKGLSKEHCMELDRKFEKYPCVSGVSSERYSPLM